MAEAALNPLLERAVQQGFEKLERALDQVIAFEVDTFKATNLTALHSILVGIFLLFAQQWIRDASAHGKTWAQQTHTALDIFAQVGPPMAAFVFFSIAIAMGCNLQFSDEAYYGRRARVRQNELVPDISRHTATLPKDIAAFPTGWHADLMLLSQTLSAVEEKFRIVAKYRDLNRRRTRTHQRVTGLLFCSVVLANIAAVSVSKIPQASPHISGL